MQTFNQPFERRLEEWKKNLIDLSKRNRLLSFKAPVTSTIQLKEPDIRTLYEFLVVDGKKMQFYLNDPRSELSDSEDRVEPELQQHRLLKSNEVFTNLPDQRLLRTLYSLRQKSRTAIREQGLVTLFVAFGFLRWYESESSDVSLLSPLILAPVNLLHPSAKDPYQLELFEEECIVNPTLAHKLKTDFNIVLPELANFELEGLNSFLINVNEAKPSYRWVVEENVYLGLFSFHKFRMYRDLEDHAEKAKEHPVIAALTGDPSRLKSPPSDLPIGSDLDTKVSQKETYQILDADSSQQEAIQAAKRGVNYVLQGPPGTGKSQTIANIIAECLAQDKQVLFVSEKMAALDVVYRRLEQAGLGDFCLQLHSHKANKKDVIVELGHTLLKPRSKTSISTDDSSELEIIRKRLNDYVRSLHVAYEPLGVSPYQACGKLVHYSKAIDLEFDFPNLSEITRHRLALFQERVNELVLYYDLLITYETHPWRGVRLSENRLQTQSDIRGHISQFIDYLNNISEKSEVISHICGLDKPRNLKEIKYQIELGMLVAFTPKPPAQWFKLETLTPLIEAAQTYRTFAEGYHHRRVSLLRRHTETILSLPLAELEKRLTIQNQTLLNQLLPASQVEARRLLTIKENVQHNFVIAIDYIRQLGQQAPALAEAYGLNPPKTVSDISDLCSLTELILQDPKPTPEWFDRSQLNANKTAAEAAKNHYEQFASISNQLNDRYNMEIININSEEILDRFMHSYKTLFRFLNPVYYQDIRILTSHLKTPSKLAYTEILRDLSQLVQYKVTKEWIESHQEVHSDLFGRHFLGFETDWSKLLESLSSCRRILDWFPENEIPTLLIRLLVSSGPPLVSISTLRQAIANNLTYLENGFSSLQQTFSLHPLPFTPLGWREEDMNDLARWLEELQEQFDDFTNAYRSASTSRIAEKDGTPTSIAQVINDIKEAKEICRQQEEMRSRSANLKQHYGHLFAGMETSWETILEALNWTGKVVSLFGGATLPESFISIASGDRSGSESLLPLVISMQETWRLIEIELNFLKTLFAPEALIIEGRYFDEVSLEELQEWLQIRLQYLPDIERWLRFKKLCEMVDSDGLGSFLQVLFYRKPPKESILPSFYKRFWSLWLDAVRARDPILHNFDGLHHQQIIERFQMLDRNQIQSNRRRVHDLLLQKRPDPNTPFGEYDHQEKVDSLGRLRRRTVFIDEGAILRREANKKKRHKPLRLLFKEIPNLLVALKPCLLMSPLSVAQFLEVEHISFDLVIFDEASQICTEDSIGAIMRGKQVIIVGDNKQLPPTRFFSAGAVEEFEDEEEEEQALSEAYESILDESLSIGLLSIELRWHYRSKCEALIAFSNKHFYNNRLVTFPNPAFEEVAGNRCVEFVHVPDGVYTSGKLKGAGTNRNEARRVAQLVLNHFDTRPQESLGVIAFSQAQQEAIDQEIYNLRKLYPHYEPFFDEERDNAFFVKNLESVQGDERDVIFFSVGYGRDQAGKLSMNFGPLNRAGGERRLNVAITRAKNHVKLISSIVPQDIDLSRTRMEGPTLLKYYMEFAQQGPAALIRESRTTDDVPFDSPFEAEVCYALEACGLVIHKQVGCSGYRIDLAVVDKDHPGQYLLGIECDGATYHSLKTARDRDRLRQEVLEGLGWRILRIWSSDWVRDPNRCIQRVINTLNEIKKEKSSFLL